MFNSLVSYVQNNKWVRKELNSESYIHQINTLPFHLGLMPPMAQSKKEKEKKTMCKPKKEKEKK